MTATVPNRKLATALICAALGTAALAPGASAFPGPSGHQDAMPSPDAAPSTKSDVAPPPSRMAAAAASGYQKLRTPDAALPARQPRLAVAEPSSPGGFDLLSAAIGAAAGAGLLVALLACRGRRTAVATS
jgi:hypothetical protein